MHKINQGGLYFFLVLALAMISPRCLWEACTVTLWLSLKGDQLKS